MTAPERKNIKIKPNLPILLMAGLSAAMAFAETSPQPGEIKPRPPATAPFHKTSADTEYRCLFNFESAIFCTFTKNRDPRRDGPEYIGSFIDKLKGTDVDAVMFCPTAWRANVYPSEIDPQWRKYKEGQVSRYWRGFDYIMKYIHDGGDPVAVALSSCRRNGIDFFISYRMNDAHHITKPDHPTNPEFWRNHPEYWLGDSNISATFKTEEDNVRMHNYILQPVRDWYFSILQELCTNYDVDGVELDFQRAPRFFYNREMDKGRDVMTGFIQRIREMLDRIGNERGKSLKLCVRVPETFAKCDKAGLDVARWDKLGFVDMINISSYYLNSLNADIEDFRSRTRHAKLYGEMLAQNQAIRAPSWAAGLRYTTIDTYRATALNFLSRGADGVSLFNYDYIPNGSPAFKDKRAEMAEGLINITNVEYLKSVPKNYVISPFRDPELMMERKRTIANDSTVELFIADDLSRLSLVLLRVETKGNGQNLNIEARWGGTPLPLCTSSRTEFSPPVTENDYGYPSAEQLKFFHVPVEDIRQGNNRIEIHNMDKDTTPCDIVSLELWVFPPDLPE